MSRPIDIVRKACPRARASYLAAIENGDALFKQHGITTPLRLAHFLAQICHESGGLSIEWESGAYSAQRLMEIFGEGHHSAAITPSEASHLAYNGAAIFERVYGLGNPRKAKELGNSRPGDGFRFRGGGLMQTTGGYNYRAMGQKCGVDFFNHPELVLSAEHALKPALAEWTQQKCNAFADNDDVMSISRAINIGNPHSSKTPNGMADRRHWLAVFKPLITKVDLIASAAPPVVVGPTPLPEVVKPPSNTARNATAGAIVVTGTVAAPVANYSGMSLSVVIAIAVVAVLAAGAALFFWKRKQP